MIKKIKIKDIKIKNKIKYPTKEEFSLFLLLANLLGNAFCKPPQTSSLYNIIFIILFHEFKKTFQEKPINSRTFTFITVKLSKLEISSQSSVILTKPQRIFWVNEFLKNYIKNSDNDLIYNVNMFNWINIIHQVW